MVAGGVVGLLADSAEVEKIPTRLWRREEEEPA